MSKRLLKAGIFAVSKKVSAEHKIFVKDFCNHFSNCFFVLREEFAADVESVASSMEKGEVAKEDICEGDEVLHIENIGKEYFWSANY